MVFKLDTVYRPEHTDTERYVYRFRYASHLDMFSYFYTVEQKSEFLAHSIQIKCNVAETVSILKHTSPSNLSPICHVVHVSLAVKKCNLPACLQILVIECRNLATGVFVVYLLRVVL